MGYDYEAMESLAYDGLITIGAVLLFITALLVPIIAANPLIQWIFGIIDWIYKLKAIGWLIAVGGVLYMLSIIWHGITITEFLLKYTCQIGGSENSIRNPKDDIDH